MSLAAILHEKTRETRANHAGLHACTLTNVKTGEEEVFSKRNGGNGAAEFRSDIADAYAELALRGAAAPDRTPI
jgi:hypothetical protein